MGLVQGRKKRPCCPIRVNILCLCSSAERAELGAFQIGAALMAQTGKESTCNAGDLGLISGSGRAPGEGNGNPF